MMYFHNIADPDTYFTSHTKSKSRNLSLFFLRKDDPKPPLRNIKMVPYNSTNLIQVQNRGDFAIFR